MKSGTSFIQSVLMENRQLLREHGYPLAGKTYGRQSRAVVGVLRGSGKPRQQKRWRRIAQEVRSAEATAGLISMEFLSFAGTADLDAFLQPFRRAEVEVVLTVRDQHRA